MRIKSRKLDAKTLGRPKTKEVLSNNNNLKFKNKETPCSVCDKPFLNKTGTIMRCETCKEKHMRKCSICKNIFVSKGNKNQCTECRREIDLNVSRKRASNPIGCIKQLLNSKINGNKYIDLTAEEVLDIYIQQDGKCALTGIDMTLGDKRKGNNGNPFSMSIDRIDNEIGYTKSNVWLIIHSLNVFKNQHHLSTIDYIIKEYYKQNCFDGSEY